MLINTVLQAYKKTEVGVEVKEEGRGRGPLFIYYLSISRVSSSSQRSAAPSLQPLPGLLVQGDYVNQG